MKTKYTDPVTKQSYIVENIYDLKIRQFQEKRLLVWFDDEVIEYAQSIKIEIIGELEKNLSKSNEIKIKHIKWIEKHGRSSKWEIVNQFPKPNNYRSEYFVSEIPERIHHHHEIDNSKYRIVTQTVTGSVTNARTMNAAIVPKTFLLIIV